MNILVDEFPKSVDINGVEYSLNTDFRTCVRIILAFEDDSLTSQEKQMIMLENMYNKIPDDVEVAIERAAEFLNGGEISSNLDSPMRLYSFAKDANLIFAAFKQTHNVDLEKERIHWWKFLALFMDLGGETTFCNLVSLRKRLKTGQASREEHRVAREIGDMIEIPEPDTRTSEEKLREEEFMRLITKNDQVGAV
jgi:hypothetical protein